MLSTRSTGSASIHDPNIDAVIDYEQQIALLNHEILQLRKVSKKLNKLEADLHQTNLLIDSGIGSKKEQAALRKNKKELRQRRVALWDKLAPLPDLEKERAELMKEVDALRRQIGLLL